MNQWNEMVEDEEEMPSEVPLGLIPYPYNRVPESFGRDTPEYPELRKLLIKTLDILDRGKGVLAPYAPKGRLQSFDVASIDVDPDSAILRVSEWQGANEIMNFLVNERLIKWDEYTEAYELVRRVQENVEEDDLLGDVSAFAKPQKNYDLKTLYREYDYMVGERMADKRFRKIMWKFKCTPEEIAEAIHLYEPSVPMDWLNHIVASVNKLKRAKESVEEDEPPSEVPVELRPYPFNQVPIDLAPAFREQVEKVLDVLRMPGGVLRVYWRKTGNWAVDYLILENFQRDGVLISRTKITNYPARLFRFLNDTLKVLKWDQGNSSQLTGYAYRLKKQIREAADEEEIEGDVSRFTPVDDSLLIRVVGNSSGPNSWYANLKGAKIRVDREPRSANDPAHPNREFYKALDYSGYIQTKDCKVLPKEEEFPFLMESPKEEDEPATDMRGKKVLKPYPLNLLPAKLPALFRDVIEVLRDPDWILELDFLRRGGPVVQVVNLINTATGEIRQLPQDKGESIYTALKSVGALVPHPEYPKHFLLKKLHESVEEEDVGDVASFDKPARTELPERIADSPTYYDAWKLFSDHFDEIADLNRSLTSDEDEYDPVIPFGYGSFESWWMGTYEGDGENEWPAPVKQITVADIERIAKEDSHEIFGLFSNIFYNHSLSDLDPLVMETICRIMLDSENRKVAARRLLGFQNDIMDILDHPSAANMEPSLRDTILRSSDSPEAKKEREIVASALSNPAKRDALIKKAIEDAKHPPRRRQ